MGHIWTFTLNSVIKLDKKLRVIYKTSFKFKQLGIKNHYDETNYTEGI